MPRKNPLPIGEIQICDRLVKARKALRLSRATFASEAGIDSTQLARYEHKLAPLKVRDALKICAAIGISLRWLATGKSDPGQCIPIAENVLPKELPTTALLSHVFDEHLASIWTERETVARSRTIHSFAGAKAFIDAAAAAELSEKDTVQLMHELGPLLQKIIRKMEADDEFRLSINRALGYKPEKVVKDSVQEEAAVAAQQIRAANLSKLG